jgi:hypothetical protein
VNVDKLEFKPDARVLGARVASSLQLEKVNVSLKLGVLAQGAQVQQATGEAMVKSGPVSVGLNAGTDRQASQSWIEG